MPGGRPSQGRQQRREWLEDLAKWLDDALAARGLSRRALATRHGLDYRTVCKIANAERLVTEDAVRYIAAAVGDSWDTVGPIWRAAEMADAKVRRDQISKKTVTLESWSNLPSLPENVEDLLDAQAEAYENLPYSLLGVNQPKLSEVYVQQQVQERGDTSDARRAIEKLPDRSEPSGDDSDELLKPVTLTDAFASHDHLVIYGEPGAGKSTLTSIYARKLARIWLGQEASQPPTREPVIPVRISAQELAGDDAWAELIASGVQRQLRRIIGNRPEPRLFAGRIQGARWMIFIDGLDEVADPATRGLVIQAIQRQMRRSDTYRIVVTSRTLPPQQKQALYHPNLGIYAISPFTPSDIEEFSAAWFRAQDPITAKERAESFATQLRAPQLSRISRNPLLVTIAAIVNTREPERPLPRNRIELYSVFTSYLLDATLSGRRIMEQLSRSAEGDPARIEFIRSTLGRIESLTEHLAVQRIEGVQEIAQAAVRWTQEGTTSLGARQQEDLIEILLAHGIFVRDGDDVRFLHQSFAEYLAARSYAQAATLEFETADEWITQALDRSKEQFVLFIFALWSRRPGCNIEKVINKLMDGGRRKLIIAGKLMSEVTTVEYELTLRLGHRIVDTLLGAEQNTQPVNDLCRSLSGWSNTAASAELLHRIESLLRLPEISAKKRLLLALALAYLRGTADPDGWFERLSQEISESDLEFLVSAWNELSRDGAIQAELAIVSRVLSSQRQPLSLLFSASAALLDIGRRETANRIFQRLIQEQCTDDVADETPKESAAFLDRKREKVELHNNMKANSQIALLASQLGKSSECQDFGWRVIDSKHATPAEVDVAVEALLQSDLAHVPRIRSALLRMNTEIQAWVLETVKGIDDGEFAQRLAVSILEQGWRVRPWDSAKALKVLLELAPNRSAEHEKKIYDWPVTSPYHTSMLAEAFQEAGQIDSAKRLGWTTLEDHRADKWDGRLAAKILLLCGVEPGVIEEASLKLDIRPSCGIAESLAERGHVPEAKNVLRERIEYWSISRLDVHRALRAVGENGDWNFARDSVVAMQKWRYLDLWEASEHCQVLMLSGADVDVAAEIGPYLSARNVPESALRALIGVMCEQQPNKVQSTIERILRFYSPTSVACGVIADTLVVRGLLTVAVDTWLHILTWESATESQFFAALGNLRECGAGDRVEQLALALEENPEVAQTIKRRASFCLGGRATASAI